MNVSDLLSLQEGKTLDFKRDLSGLDGILKTVIAFANTAGGEIVVGVDDDKAVVGLKDAISDEEKISRAVQDSISPPIALDVSFHTHEGKDLLLLTVPHIRQGPFHLKSKGTEEGTFFRYGSTSSRAEPETIAELKRWKDALDFSQEPLPELTRDDLDLDYATKLFAERDISVDDAKYKSLNMLSTHGDTTVPTKGGLILFGRDPQAVFPDARFRCAAFDGLNKVTFRARKDFETALIHALTDVQQFVDQVTLKTVVVEGMQNQEIPEYPPVGIREVLINAIAHADYSRKGTPLSLAVFDDRLEVVSPGSLPFGMTIERMRQGESTIRNRAIARVLHTLGYMEEWGSGYQRILETCQEGGYPEPEWEDTGQIVRVTFFPHPHVRPVTGQSATQSATLSASGRLADRPARLDEVMAAIKILAKPTAAQIEEHTGISTRTLGRDLAHLSKEKRIRRVGGRQRGHYELIQDPDDN